jgi:hypothetical protein
MNAATASGLFLHIEQHRNIRVKRCRTSSKVEHGLLPGTRRASLPQAQDAPEAPLGPWGTPESFYQSKTDMVLLATKARYGSKRNFSCDSAHELRLAAGAETVP